METRANPEFGNEKQNRADAAVWHPVHHAKLSESVETPSTQEPVLRVLAMDNGPQSATALLLSVDGDIPPLDLAIFADRVQDRPRIFAQLARIQQIAVSAGVPILRITSDGPPAEAISTKIRQILGYPEPRPVPPGVTAELAIAVSLDEVHRAADSDMPYLRHIFPLLDLGWTRRECEGYLRSLHLENTPKATRLRRGWTL